MVVGQQPAHRPASECRRRVRQRLGIGGIDLRAEQLEELGVVAKQLGLPRDDRRHVPFRDLVEQRHQLGPHAVAAEREIVVRRIVDRLETLHLAESPRLPAAHPQQRVATGRHAGEAVEACAPQQVQ